MEYFAAGNAETSLDTAAIERLLDQLLEQLGSLRRVLLIPPDHTRAHSYAGEITAMLYHRLNQRSEVAILPALGTHSPMSEAQLQYMFPGVPIDVFRIHNWRTDPQTLGEVPATFISNLTGDRLDYPITCEVNRLLLETKWDQIISIGQVVPHEVVGMANQSKNIFIGTGGADTINKSHYVGAVCGMEQAMGRSNTPVRSILRYMSEHFGTDLPITYLLTVRAHNETRQLVTCGLFAGTGEETFEKAARLSHQVNLDLLDEPLKKVVVYLRPDEFKSTWLGNKAIYRTRMALADDGELIILAPGVREFGEDAGIDQLIRKYGYRGTPNTLQMVADNPDLASNLAAAAHLIHGSSEGRFRVTYCPGGLTRQEVEQAAYSWLDTTAALARYNPAQLKDGWNDVAGESIYYISNPALGLWGLKSQFPKFAEQPQ